ncbi:ABC transporter ATP-binding protein [Paenibacillus hunanensis]|uniref:ATP-binding cassette subfamily B protein n=1 Tax=Paenibacillus hunanensis TaxID=539262 RepID=A0ABU1J1K4_9BACL|nr:ABC transporter ATP-binding protein [Paenibacillus hunanensis]MDR6245380.1 ATP-binding cassette subfamily B protein [Paenibacillus hunanensis]GGJ27156.1 ABC transporter permease [Paenibacillus hunanensis]
MKTKSENIFTIFIKVLPDIFHGAPVHFVYMNIVALVYSVLWFSILPANNYMFDTIIKAANGQASVKYAIIAILIVFAILTIQHVFNGLNAYNNMYQYFKVYGYLHYRIHKKVDQLPAIKFEDPSIMDDINKSIKGSENAMLLVNIIMNMIFFYIPQLLFYSIYFYFLNPYLVLVVFLIFIPQAISSILQSKFHINLEQEVAPIRRELDNYDKSLTGIDFFKETRMLRAYGYFIKLYKDTQLLLNSKAYAVEKKIAMIRLYMALMTLTGYIGVLYILLQTVLSGAITIGSFGAIFISLSSLLSIIKEITFGSFNELSKNFGTVLNYKNFMNMNPTEKMAEQNIDFSKGIKISNVSFQYPNTNKKALNNISLHIHNKETIAIVGENGAGKSTLVRLLLGIYRPQSGSIIIGDIENTERNPYIPQNNISAVFQKFQKYALTLKENVTISDIKSDDNIIEPIQNAGLAVNSKDFPQGELTMLSREFGGTDLSGGQWQRVAIARGLFRKHDLIILDEPTAAIDPIEESSIFRTFRDISKNKIAVIVTHRLGSAKIADRIVVMDEGQIIEEGTHEALMRLNGKYAYMFNEQAKWYEHE